MRSFAAAILIIGAITAAAAVGGAVSNGMINELCGAAESGDVRGIRDKWTEYRPFLEMTIHADRIRDVEFAVAELESAAVIGNCDPGKLLFALEEMRIRSIPTVRGIF